MKKISNLILKYKELIIYVFFGGCTTLVNLAVFFVFNRILNADGSTTLHLISNAIAWVAAVIFAYITNKLWVFESVSWEKKVIIKEIPSFFAARVFSFLLEEAGLWLMLDLLGFDELILTVLNIDISGAMISKAMLAVIVVILNYIFSKLVIFKKKTQD